MTDVPPGTGRPGDDPAGYVPTGVRRSTFTPPPAPVDPPAFDDDALADALAAQVASYTAPIPVTPPQGIPAPEVAWSPVPESPVAPEPAAPEPPVASEPSAPREPLVAEVPAAPLAEPPSPTLEAIERLENELRRRAEEAQAAAAPAPAPAPPAPPAFAPPAFDAPTSAPPSFEPPQIPEPPSSFETPQIPEPPSAFETPQIPELPLAFEPPPAFEPATFGTPVASPVGPPPAESSAPLESPVESPVESPSESPVGPPPLVEPPASSPALPSPFAPPASLPLAPLPPPSFGTPPTTPPVELPPPGPAGPVDFAQLPPPFGLEPAALPPYDPTRDAALDVAAPGPTLPPPHPDDVGDAAEASDPSSTVSPAADDDAVDEIDRAFGTGAIVVDSTGSVTVLAPPSQPIPTVRLADDEAALVDEEPESHPALLVESAGPEATALDLRAGRAARLFWLWFAANSSIVSLSVGAVLFGLGMSLRQTLVAILIGVALSFLPLGLGTLAGKWSGQPTMIVSRASFGLVGNALPALLAVVSRVFWGGALLWLLSTGVASVLVDAGLDVGLGAQLWTLVALGVGFALVLLVAIFGYGLLARVQLVLSIVTGLLVVGVIVLTFPRLDIAAAQGIADGPWTLLVTGVVLVFSFVGLAWVHSSADVARYQRGDSDGGSSMLWATFGATLPAFILLAWGALLAASDPLIAEGLATNPLYTVAALLPIWYPAPLLAALGLGLLSAAVLTIYSGGFALQSLGVGLRRSATTALAGLLVLAAALALVLLVGEARGLIRDVATTIAVPVAAWAGIFGAEMMIRRRGFDADSLLRRGGSYPAVRWVNLVGLVVISAIGFGLTSAVLPWLDWQGYLLPFLGLGADDPLLTSDVGVLVALVLGILLPLATAVPAIRRQERALVD